MKKIEPKTLSGFMELNPDDQVLFDSMINIIKETYKKYGFWGLDTPIIEYSEVLLAKAGGETEKQIYRFNKGDNDLSLRFDLTVPLAKYVAARYNELSFPFKRYQIGKVFRGERPQKGRYREFYQCDIDVIGDNELSLSYDAEMPAIIYDVFNKLNIGKFIIRINNRKILNGFFENLELTDKSSDILRIIDKIEKISEEEIIEILKDDYNVSEEKISKILKLIKIKGTNQEILNELRNMNINNDVFKTGINELETVINTLKEMDVDEEYFSIDLSIARGLDYYTGIVYETKLVDYPQIGSICSGGRYDNLAEYYTDKKLPGVGISIGFTRLFYQLKEMGIIKNEYNGCADIMVLPMTNDLKVINKVAQKLRIIGKSVNVCYSDRKFKSKMKYADNCRVKFAVIIGEDEIKEDSITIKNMESGNQELVKISDIEKYFLQK